MKILLAACNAKYIHSNLAVYDLKAYSSDYDEHVILREYTINQPKDEILKDIYSSGADVVCFSCYIWNIEQTRKLAADLKMACPELLLTAGGPEASSRGPAFARENPWVDFVLRGEGEYPFYRLCQVLHEPQWALETVPGLIYRQDGKIYVNAEIEPIDFNAVPFP